MGWGIAQVEGGDHRLLLGAFAQFRELRINFVMSVIYVRARLPHEGFS